MPNPRALGPTSVPASGRRLAAVREQCREAVVLQIELLVGAAQLVDHAGQFVDARVTRGQQVLQSFGIGLLEL